MELSWNPNIKCKEKLVTTLSLSSNISLNDTSFHISLNSWKFFLSTDCSLNFLLYVPLCVGKLFQFYGIHIPKKCIESRNFYSCPNSPIKTPGRNFENLFAPRRKGWKKPWFALLKYNQKISRWPGKLIYFTRYTFAWFVIFWNVMALKLCELYLSDIVVLSSLPLSCNHGNLTLRLCNIRLSEKIATLRMGDFFIGRFKVGSLPRIINK